MRSPPWWPTSSTRKGRKSFVVMAGLVPAINVLGCHDGLKAGHDGNRRVGKGAPAPCPPPRFEREKVGTLRFAHPTAEVSKRIGHDAAVDAQRRAIGGARSFRAEIADQIGDLFRLGVALQQRGRPALAER